MLTICKGLLSVSILLSTLAASSGITYGHNESVNELRYCLRKSPHPNFKECVGRTAISFLQRLDERDHFKFADSFVVTRDDTAASRSLINFLDTDPVDFRGILENAGAVFSQRSLEFHMDALYPGLMFKIGPSADSNSVAEFILDPALAERNFNYEEASTARILTKQYLLPFLLGFKFNLVALVPVLFAIICLLLKKTLFIAKLVIYVSSILGVGGAAGVLGALGGWNGIFGGHGLRFGAGIPPHPNVGPIAGGLGVFPAKNTFYSQYEQDELQQYNSPYKRQNRKVIFEKTRGSHSDLRMKNSNDVRPTVEPALAATVTDNFYDYEKQILMQDRSGRSRQTNIKFSPSDYGEGNNKQVATIVTALPEHRFKAGDSSDWKAINLRT